MFNYYGSKSRLVDLYPSPKFQKIIEPFAGSARYSLKHFEKEVLLVDKYDVVIKIWKWLQQCSVKDVMGLPVLKKGDKLSDLNLSEGERLFMGMINGVSSTSPRNTASSFASEQNGRKNKFKHIADQLFKIKHWKFIHGDYKDLPNENITWFIDPPYKFGGHAYVENEIDFVYLS
ncbi:MAG TPA: hypothetical protein VNY73_00960, partial [Bacteroidia bacterium]|nr:hypothetical protein [Bacteroidia bacterium]